jgi:hypothetical protein
LEETLDAAHKSFDWMLDEGIKAVYWAATATIALLVVLDRRDDAIEVLDIVRSQTDVSRFGGVINAPILDVLTALTRIGAGEPKTAGKELAASATDYLSGSPLQDGDYLVLFAAFRAEMGDVDRANELMEAAPVKNGHINWLVWPFVWNWGREEFEERNEERRLWELERMERAGDLRTPLPRYMAEEIEFWMR